MNHLGVPWIVSRVADSDPGVLVGSGFLVGSGCFGRIRMFWSDPGVVWSDPGVLFGSGSGRILPRSELFQAFA